jgi:Cation/multidrug efflux pump
MSSVTSLTLSLVVMYLLFVAYYHSFIISVIAMTTILLGLAGVSPGHWIMGQPFCAPSLAGIIALSGVAARGSLLIIDFAKENLSRGMPLKEAVCEAGAVRLRPILLTTLAVMSGTAVMLSDELFGGLACSLIFGTLASTIFSVVVAPILFYLFMRYR